MERVVLIEYRITRCNDVNIRCAAFIVQFIYRLAVQRGGVPTLRFLFVNGRLRL